jgi:hypothetical protein
MAELESREAIETNWDAVTNAFEGKKVETETPPPPIQEEKKPEQQENVEELKIDEKAPETITPEQEAEALKAEAKELGLEESATKEQIEAKRAEIAAADKPIIEFKAEDIEGNEKEPPEGSWFAVAKEAGIKIENDTFEDFQKALIAPYVKQAEEAKTMAVENLFQGLNPKTVAAFKLMEMGVDESELFEPTKKIDGYLALDNAALIRADKEAMGWKPETIDAELELLETKNLINHEAEKLRMALNVNKEAILNERKTYIEQYESKKEQAILAQKEQEKSHFKKAMDTVQSFMDVPIPNDVKEAVTRKFNNGAYDDILATPESKAEYILYKELGKKITNTLKSTAFAKGKEEIRAKLLSVPPVTNNNAGQQQKINQDSNDPWAAVDKMAKAIG